MRLPFRIQTERPRETVISVDGAFGAPGLELSHWPGNRTPRALRHDLSTGAALAFARLPARERDELAHGATAIVNNHYDTDGVCALFATRFPELALAYERALLDAAAAGDFFRIPSRAALAIDALVSGLADPERSLLAAELASMDDLGRWNAALAHLLEHLPAILEGNLGPYRALWEPALADADKGLAALARAERLDEPAIGLTCFMSQVAPRVEGFDPGRHPLFGSTDAVRVLACARGPGGTSFRLILSPLGWFDLAKGTRFPHVDLAPLAAALNELEGTASGATQAWRAEAHGGASPELWFGGSTHERFGEHHHSLGQSRLAPDRVLALLRNHLAQT